jgi:hypothetical protein
MGPGRNAYFITLSRGLFLTHRRENRLKAQAFLQCIS